QRRLHLGVLEEGSHRGGLPRVEVRDRSGGAVMSPVRLFRTVAIAEAITWTGLLIGMFLKYGPPDNELGVRIFGMAHGVVFVAYAVTTVVVWVDRRWSMGRGLLALFAAVPPLATLP